jgi:hypothetical protein
MTVVHDPTVRPAVSIDDDKTTDELSHLRGEVKRLRKALNRQPPELDMLLRRRGFTIYKKEPADDLLLPAKKFFDRYYQLLHKYSFRLFLRDVIKHQGLFTLEQVARYATPAVTRKYLDNLLSFKLITKKQKSYSLVSRPITSFGPTLEWYVAEVFKREFGAEAVWGVKFKRPRVGGDYDVLARLEGSLFSIEVKSSPPKQIYDSEIAAFFDRVVDLAPEVAIFLMDTELRMKDKIVPMFEKVIAKRSPDPFLVACVERELFHIQDRVFIMNAKESIVQNLEKTVRCLVRNYHLRWRS